MIEIICVSGFEDKHEVQRDHPAAGGHKAKRAHEPARGDRLHHLRVPGKLAAQGGAHQEDQLRGHRQQQADHGVPPGHRPAQRQLPEHESQEDQAGGEEGNGVRHGREVRPPILV